MTRIKIIKGFPEYSVSDTGDVYSNNYRQTGKTIKLRVRKTGCGYLQVSLRKDNQTAEKLIHRLVAEAFIPNTKNKPQVNHKNGIKTDNRVENLEWVTHSENQKHSYEHLGRTRFWLNKKGKDNPRTRKVIQIKGGVPINWFYGLANAAIHTGISVPNICNCCNKKQLSAGGYQWEYEKREK